MADPSGEGGAGTAGEAGTPAEPGAPGERPEDHRQGGDDAGDGEVGAEVVELPRPVEGADSRAVDVEELGDHADDRGGRGEDGEDQQRLDPEGTAVRSARFGGLPRGARPSHGT